MSTKVADEMIPSLAGEGLIDAVDGFCERIAFTRDEIARVFAAARRAGLPVKLHADQLSNLGRRVAGGQVRRAVGRSSRISRRRWRRGDGDGRRDRGPASGRLLRFARAPGASGRPLRKHRLPMAVATDSNPGTSPLTSLLLAINMAATLFGLTVDECLAGATPQRGARARPCGRDRNARSRQMGRSRDMGHRTSG